MDHPLARGLSRLGRRRTGAPEHPWVLDTVIVVVALMFCVPDLVHDDDGRRHAFDTQVTHLPWPVTVALQAGLVLPLLWRRRRPSLAFAVIAAVLFLQVALGVRLRADVALLIALYSLVLHGQLRRLPVACAVTAAALGLVALRLPSAVSVLDALFVLFSTITAAVALGLAVRIRRAQLAVLRDRATRLEIERDQRSKLAAAAEESRRMTARCPPTSSATTCPSSSRSPTAARTRPTSHRNAASRPCCSSVTPGVSARRTAPHARRAARAGTRGPPRRLSPQPGIADIDALCAGSAPPAPVVPGAGGELDTLDREVQLERCTASCRRALRQRPQARRPRRRRRASRSASRTRDCTSTSTTPAGVGAVPAGPFRRKDADWPGVRERAALYDGTVTAGPAPGGIERVPAILGPKPAGRDPGGDPGRDPSGGDPGGDPRPRPTSRRRPTASAV